MDMGSFLGGVCVYIYIYVYTYEGLDSTTKGTPMSSLSGPLGTLILTHEATRLYKNVFSGP